MVRLAAEMLRYRVAVMIWMFLMLGVARGGAMSLSARHLIAATAALAFSYIAATTVNDLADEDVDKVNHPTGRGRPLVHGTASRAQLWRLNVVAAMAALVCAAAVGQSALVIVAASLVIAYAYSVRPLLLSYRTYLAHVVLALAYVVIPYLLGISVAGQGFASRDAVFVSGLFLLFLARIVLKDFRDREGDARYGKPTLLLRFGKDATCGVSLACLLLGAAVLVVALDVPAVMTVVIILFTAAIASRLAALRSAQDGRSEQIAIGIGARLGNGLLLCMLAWLLITPRGATIREQVLLLGLLVGVHAAAFVVVLRSPDDVVLAYKGYKG